MELRKVRPQTSFASWEVTHETNSEIEFTGIRAMWRWRRGEFSGLKAYVIFSIPIFLISVLVSMDALSWYGGELRYISWSQLGIGLSSFLPWFGWPVALSLRPNLVWKASKGLLAVNNKMYHSSEVL